MKIDIPYGKDGTIQLSVDDSLDVSFLEAMMLKLPMKKK